MAVHKIDGVDGDNNFPVKHVTLHCTGTVSAGDWVQIDIGDSTNGLGASVEIAAVSSNLVFGIATHDAVSGDELKVQISGKYENANVVTGTAAELQLIPSAATAGRAITAVGGAVGVGIVCGVSLEVAAANVADVMIIDQGYFG